MDGNQNAINDGVQKIAVEYGSGVTGVALTGVLYATGLLIKDTWLRETAVPMGSAL